MIKYVVAVSGGADSMTLLDQCVKQNLLICVAHVNYQKRETALRDQRIVERYCAKHGIDCFIKSCDEPLKGNFQAAARDFRYAFFKQISLEQHCDAVLVAHQMDDVLETYLMQKETKRIPLVYGLAESCEVHGLKIKRPLLSMTKKDCYDYCHLHHIEYGDDESNFSNVYYRNRIRHQVIDLMSEDEKQMMLDEIKKMNEQKKNEMNEYQALLHDDLDIEALLNSKNPSVCLRYWLNAHQLGYECSDKMLKGIIEDLKKKQHVHLVFNEIEVIDSYHVLQVIHNIDYCYTFENIEEFSCPYFKVSKKGNSLQAVTLSEDDFPITIRSYKKGDAIALRYGTKAINRFFIDRKISHKERKIWPIVVNCKGNVILVPEIGCDIKHYTNKPNCFVIK